MRIPGSVALAALGIALVVVGPASARRGIPPTIELDGCILPAEACPSPRDVVELRVGDRKLELAVEHLRFVTTTGLTTGKVLTELELRPVQVHGPKELDEKLRPGARLRLRGALRLAPHYLLLQSVEPLPTR
jgi:hypothetical protein